MEKVQYIDVESNTARYMSQFWAVTGSAGISAGMLGAKQIGDQKQHRITLDLDSGGVLTSRYYQLFNCSSTTEKHFPTGKDTINSVTNVLAEKSIRSSDYLNPEPRMPILKSHNAISKPWNLRRVENQVTICWRSFSWTTWYLTYSAVSQMPQWSAGHLLRYLTLRTRVKWC